MNNHASYLSSAVRPALEVSEEERIKRLAGAMRSFVGQWSKHSGIEAQFHTSGLDKERLSPETETNLYRTCRRRSITRSNMHR
jgi:signal transduction histidine kinase